MFIVLYNSKFLYLPHKDLDKASQFLSDDLYLLFTLFNIFLIKVSN
jgi:hypothetical protein